MKERDTVVRAIRFSKNDDKRLQVLALKKDTTVGLYLKHLVLKIIHSNEDKTQ